jgi:hypothetical protein
VPSVSTPWQAHRVTENAAATNDAHGEALSPQNAEDSTDAGDLQQLEFTCPRCRLEVSEQFYGPCTSCRTTLRVQVGGEAREVESAAYEPKMNVTPNAVATKE